MRCDENTKTIASVTVIKKLFCTRYVEVLAKYNCSAALNYCARLHKRTEGFINSDFGNKPTNTMCTSIQRPVVDAGMIMPCEGHLRRKNVRFNLQENRVCYFRDNSATSDLSSITPTTTYMSRWSSAAEKDSRYNVPKLPRRYQNTDFLLADKGVTEHVPRMPRRSNSYITTNHSSTARAA